MLRGVVDGRRRRRGGGAADARADPRLTPRETPTVYLVAHDPETAARLAERRLVEVPRRAPEAEAVAA